MSSPAPGANRSNALKPAVMPTSDRAIACGRPKQPSNDADAMPAMFAGARPTSVHSNPSHGWFRSIPASEPIRLVEAQLQHRLHRAFVQRGSAPPADPRKSQRAGEALGHFARIPRKPPVE